MRILIGTHHLARLGGTEMWTRVMYDALSLHNRVDVFARTTNSIFPDMTPYDPRARYDLALINHNQTMRALRHMRAARVIMTIHGTTPPLEWPVFGADAYVSVSEWERDFIPLPSTVIRNPIETWRFAPTRRPSQRLRRVAMMTNYGGPAHRILREACEILGVELRSAGLVSPDGTTAMPEALMNWADLVVGVGRTALEAMSCGRNVFLLGQWGAGGMVTPENVRGLGHVNWSGAQRGDWPTPVQLADEIAMGYDPKRDLRPYVLEHHAPHLIAGQYLAIGAAITRRRRAVTSLIRRGPRPLTTARFMTVADPVLRELRGRRSADGRPGVLAPVPQN